MPTTINLKTIAKAKKEAAAQDRSLYLWDDQLSGFGAYVSFSPPHQTSWLIQKWQGGRGGKAQRVVIGSTKNGMQLEDAKKAASIALGEVANGKNLAAHKRQQRSKLRDELNNTLLSAFETYLSQRSKDTQYWREIEVQIKAAIGQIGSKTAIASVTKADVKKVLAAKADAPAAQRILFVTLRTFFDWCVQEDLIAASPMASLKAPRPVASRDRQLSAEEIGTYWKASGAIPYPFGHYFRLLLLLAQRREEVGGIRIDEIDLDTRRWTIPGERTKNGKAHIVHLSELALEVLKDALRCQQELAEKVRERRPKDRKTNCYFILTTNNQTAISGYSKAKTKLDGEMRKVTEGDKLLNGSKFSPFRIHDLRRTFASHLASLGIPTDVADRALNHISGSSVSGVKGVYQRYEFLPEREKAMAVWGEHVTRIVSPQSADNQEPATA